MRGNFVNNYFGFNKQQRNGLLVLVGISFLLLVIRISFPYFITPEKLELKNLASYQQTFDSVGKLNNEGQDQKHGANTSVKNHKLFVFDPNEVSHGELLQLGFSEKTAGIFLKFRAKGFVFKQKQDLKKVYGISENFYAQLEPFVQITTSPAQLNTPAKEKTNSVPPGLQTNSKLELNTADSVALIALPGIGSGYAKRIIKYRSLLGGYAHVNQLKEVYGMSGELFEKIRGLVFIADGPYSKINLNKDDFKQINKHPYISYELTKKVCDWRRKTTISPENFRDMVNDSALYAKVLPYLAFE